MSNTLGRTDWAEDDEPDLASAIPAPQITKNKDGTETHVTHYLNDQGQLVKRTQRIRRTVVKRYEKASIAARRALPKFGAEAGRAPGPHPDTTTLGENIIFRPQVGYKPGGVVEKSAEENKKEQALKSMAIKCRICHGEHFTSKCPFKDTMAPEGEAGAGMPAANGDVGNDAPGGLGNTGSSYVPPHLRRGAAGGAGGERMGGKFERDDLATLRVTNVSLSSGNGCFDCHMYTNSLSGQRICGRERAQRSVRALRSRHQSFLGQGPRYRSCKGVRVRVVCRPQ